MTYYITLTNENKELIYPNIKYENIPDKCIDIYKISDSYTDYILSKVQIPVINSATTDEILGFTSNKGVYVSTDDGYWYSWDGSSYVKGMPFQSMIIPDNFINTSMIANNSVTELKTTFIKSNEYNLFNKDTSIDGKFIYFETGLLLDNADYTASDYIEVHPNSIITIVGAVISHFAGYNEDKTFIKLNAGDNVTSFRVTAQTKYIRISYDHTKYDTNGIMVLQGLDFGYKSYYELPYDYILKETNEVENLVDKWHLIKGLFIYFESGWEQNNNTHVCTDFIPVTAGKTIYFNHSLTHFAFYKQDGTTIPPTWGTSGTTQVVVPDDAVNVRFSWNLQSLPLLVATYEPINNDVEENSVIKIYQDGTGDYTDLKEGITAAFQKGNQTVYIRGVRSFTDNLYSTFGSGMYIGKNNHYIFETGSKIIFNNGSKESQAQGETSIFYNAIGSGDFILENAYLYGTEIRYCVHDENGGPNANTPYKHTYKNCYMEHYNSNGVTTVCIGGGLSNGATIELLNCVFIDTSPETSATQGTNDVLYHPNWDTTTAVSDIYHIVVEGCYFNKTYRISAPVVAATEKSIIQISNNSFGRELINNDTYNVEWTVYAWNNELRS